jgi:hypothetical protein
MLGALPFGMDSADFKELLAFLGGVALLYFQYRTHREAVGARTEAKDAKAELGQKLQTVETNVNSRTALLLTEHGLVKRQEGRDEGKAEARAEDAAIRNAVKDAVKDATAPQPPPDAAGGT